MEDLYDEFDPDTLYAPVGTHESLRMIYPLAARRSLILEGADISNAYLNSRIDKPLLMEQPTNSTGHVARPRFGCELKMSLSGAWKARRL